MVQKSRTGYFQGGLGGLDTRDEQENHHEGAQLQIPKNRWLQERRRGSGTGHPIIYPDMMRRLSFQDIQKNSTCLILLAASGANDVATVARTSLERNSGTSALRASSFSQNCGSYDFAFSDHRSFPGTSPLQRHSHFSVSHQDAACFHIKRRLRANLALASCCPEDKCPADALCAQGTFDQDSWQPLSFY